MAVSKMRSGRWRAQVYCNGRNVAVGTVLGHTDGGRLVQTLYGHLDEHVALDRALTAFEQAGTVTPIRKTGHR